MHVSANASQGELRIAPVIVYDPETRSFAAWCDQLAVATSAPTEEEARAALVDAMRLAADFAQRNAASLGAALASQLPAAELVMKKSDSELAQVISVTTDLRPT